MPHVRSTRPTTRPIRIRRLRAAGLLVVVVAIAAIAGDLVPVSSSPTATPSPTAESAIDGGRGPHRGALGVADGAVPDGTSVFDDGIPGVANLDPDLLGALRRAATDAAEDGVAFTVGSGWRSPGYQQRLLDRAIATYGSAEEAARWVATPGTSAHVSGDAVDIDGSRATAWLSASGARYGLCQVYGNEPWHHELRPEAVEQGCPAPYADPTEDPRMRG